MKLTKSEKRWVLYDVGNSAFILLATTILPIYWGYLAGRAGLNAVDYLAYWGYASSAATLLVAISAPVFGTLADNRGFKKPIFLAAIALGGIGCLTLGFVKQWLCFLILFVLTRFGYAVSLVFYDSMLIDVTKKQRMDTVSASGYAWGYIGSCIPFLACLGLVLGAESFGLSMESAMTIAFAITALWWLFAALPLIRHYRQTHYVERAPHAIRRSFARLWQTLRSLKRQKQILYFLLAFFFYIDGVYTIIDMATVYGSALGLDQAGLLLALLVTQIVAFPSTILIGRLARRIAPEKLIFVSIFAYIGIAILAMLMHRQIHFWILAFCVGLFQGGIQALSRSYFAKIIPAEKSGEYFGLMDICGKGAAFLGTAIVSGVSQLTDNVNLGVGAIGVLFIIGSLLFRKAVKVKVRED